MRILIVEDNKKLATSLAKGLSQEGYAADALYSGEEAERRVITHQSDYDLVILDISLPGKSGIEVCQILRERGIMIPVIMLTARDTTENIVTGLDSGADDYLVKPFSLSVLLARIRALSRRPRSGLPPDLAVGAILLKSSSQEVFIEGKKIDLTLTEFRLLEFFMSHTSEVVSRQQIIDHLWDFDFNPLSRVMDVHMNNLRNKIKKNHGANLETIRGVGYRLTA